jgi:hypothetical protein
MGVSRVIQTVDARVLFDQRRGSEFCQLIPVSAEALS